jgi:U32 family peptidase
MTHHFNKQLINKLTKKLKAVYNRGFSTGFYLGKPINEWTKAYGSKSTKKKVYIGVVKNFYNKLNVAEIKLETQGLNLNDTIMFQGNKTGVKEQKVISMQINKKEVKKVKKGQSVGLKTLNKIRKNDRVYLIL